MTPLRFAARIGLKTEAIKRGGPVPEPRKLIVCNIMSLDGYYARPDDNVMVRPMDETFDAYNLERLRAADTLLLGRVSYEMFSGFRPSVQDDPAASDTNRQFSRLDNAIDKVVLGQHAGRADGAVAEHPRHPARRCARADRRPQAPTRQGYPRLRQSHPIERGVDAGEPFHFGAEGQTPGLDPERRETAGLTLHGECLPIRHNFSHCDVRNEQMTRETSHSRRPTPEERRFLEALCLWRALYAERGPQDSDCVATVASTISAAELRMRTLRISDDRMRRRFIGG